VVLDSITELQRRCKANIQTTGVLSDYRDWGELLVNMDRLIRGFRDLTLQPGPVRCVLFVAELTQNRAGIWVPYMQGAIQGSLPYWVDICGYLSQARVADANGSLTVREVSLFTASNPSFVTGERVQGVLPDTLIRPNLTEILRTVYPHAPETGAVTS